MPRSVLIDGLSKDNLNNQETGFAYVYLDFDNRDQQTVPDIIGVMIRQLIHLPKIPEQIEKIWIKYRDDKARVKREETILMLCEACKAFTETCICIDALDECKEETLERLMEYLTEAHSNVTSIRLVCTGRPQILSRKPISKLNPYRISIKAHEPDVRAFIEWKVAERDKTPQFMNKELKEEIIRKILGIFGEMFVIIRYACDLSHIDFLADFFYRCFTLTLFSVKER